jgi:hypothetical protein
MILGEDPKHVQCNFALVVFNIYHLVLNISYCVWLCMALYGSVWLCMALYGSI